MGVFISLCLHSVLSLRPRSVWRSFPRCAYCFPTSSIPRRLRCACASLVEFGWALLCLSAWCLLLLLLSVVVVVVLLLLLLLLFSWFVCVACLAYVTEEGWAPPIFSSRWDNCQKGCLPTGGAPPARKAFHTCLEKHVHDRNCYKHLSRRPFLFGISFEVQ